MALKRDKIILWVSRHRGLMRFIQSFCFFVLAWAFFNSAYNVFDDHFSGGAYLTVGVGLMMVAGFCWKNATDFSDWGQEPESYDEAIARHDAEIQNILANLSENNHEIKMMGRKVFNNEQ